MVRFRLQIVLRSLKDQNSWTRITNGIVPTAKVMFRQLKLCKFTKLLLYQLSTLKDSSKEKDRLSVFTAVEEVVSSRLTLTSQLRAQILVLTFLKKTENKFSTIYSVFQITMEDAEEVITQPTPRIGKTVNGTLLMIAHAPRPQLQESYLKLLTIYSTEKEEP